jgi:hypothetical protein
VSASPYSRAIVSSAAGAGCAGSSGRSNATSSRT